jgi:hypothetical protein
MKYQFFDYHLLQSISPKGGDTMGSVYENLTSYILSPVTMPCFLFSLRGLMAGGYIEVESRDGAVTPVTPISLTEAGRKAVTVSAFQKLFGELKAIAKKEKVFCALDRPDAAYIVLSAEGSDFAPITQKLMKARDIAFPTFELTDLGDGIMKLTVHHPNDDPVGIYDAEDIDPDSPDLAYSASVTGEAEQIMAGMRDLISAAHALLTQPPRTRKVALHGSDGSLLITLARAANETGLVSLRMTVAKIRFNRQRFVGKRDGDLDYAQCGNPIFITELRDEYSFAYWDVLHSAIAYPSLLTEEDLDKLTDIHRISRPSLL